MWYLVADDGCCCVSLDLVMVYFLVSFLVFLNVLYDSTFISISIISLPFKNIF